MSVSESCPSCSSTRLDVFYKVEGVPTNSCLLMDSYEEAIHFPKGRIVLSYCNDCGFIFNAAFDPTLTEYSGRYEETQAFSPTFNRYHHALAEDLIERYDLRQKKVTEIGCGKGEFLNLLCEIGENVGFGFDPGYLPDRNKSATERVTFFQDLFSERYAEYCGDFVCSKMTLEHIPNVADFIGMIRRSIGNALSTVVFFEVPESFAILREFRFWDIYYEHCSYFTTQSIQQLFARSAFDVLNVATDYGDQYLKIEARPASNVKPIEQNSPEEVAKIRDSVARFGEICDQRISYWRQHLDALANEGKRVALWGSSSKGVSFLTTLGIGPQVDCVVDINPYRQGKFMPGSGHKIVSPEELNFRRPDLVIVMNPIYCKEIQKSLDDLGLSAELQAL